MPLKLFTFFFTVVLLSLGCGENASGPTTVSSASRLTTQRPEIAFFTTQGNAIYDLGIADDRGKHRRILTGRSIEGSVFPQLFTSVSWSSDGSRIAFAGVKGRQTDEHDEPTDIYSIDAHGSNVTRLTTVGDAGSPLWSPNRRMIIFTRMSDGHGEPIRGSLWSVRTNGSRLRRLLAANDWQVYVAGSFTRNGSRLAVTHGTYNPHTGQASSDVELINADGSNRDLLIADASDPAFSPDGKRLAFVSDRDKNGQLCYGDQCSYAGELYLANADGSRPKRLTKTRALNEAHPSWLLDGSRIAYQRGEVFQNAQATSILEVNKDGHCGHAILAGSGPGAWYASPAWRPSKPRQGGGSLRCY